MWRGARGRRWKRVRRDTGEDVDDSRARPHPEQRRATAVVMGAEEKREGAERRCRVQCDIDRQCGSVIAQVMSLSGVTSPSPPPRVKSVTLAAAVELSGASSPPPLRLCVPTTSASALHALPLHTLTVYSLSLPHLPPPPLLPASFPLLRPTTLPFYLPSLLLPLPLPHAVRGHLRGDRRQSRW